MKGLRLGGSKYSDMDGELDLMPVMLADPSRDMKGKSYVLNLHISRFAPSDVTHVAGSFTLAPLLSHLSHTHLFSTSAVKQR